MAELEAGLILAIDTSTDVRVGLARTAAGATSGDVLAAETVSSPHAHAEQLLPLINRVLAAAGVSLGELSGIVVGLGPGPFTGLRVGIVTAQVLAHGLGIPLRGVCSLDVAAAAWSAAGAPAEGFVIASDARRSELYWARYDSAGLRLAGPEVTAPEQLPDLPVGGPGADIHPLVQRGRPAVGPRELDMGLLAAIAGRLPDAGTEPLYLRRPDATVPTTRKSTLLQPRLGGNR